MGGEMRGGGRAQINKTKQMPMSVFILAQNYCAPLFCLLAVASAVGDNGHGRFFGLFVDMYSFARTSKKPENVIARKWPEGQLAVGSWQENGIVATFFAASFGKLAKDVPVEVRVLGR